MILDGSRENALVIPRWLAYRDATASGELAVPQTKEFVFNRDFQDQFKFFQAAPNYMLATELLGAAFLDDRPEAVELAKYIVGGPGVQKPAQNLALRILGQSAAPPSGDATVSMAIRRIKTDLRRFPRNASKWVDLGRYYTACGQNNAAIRALRVAVALAPNDRFCIRALCRLLIHLRDYPAAYDIFRKNPSLLKDSWLLAPAASVATLAEKPSPLPRLLNIEVSSETEAFHKSELFEAFGTAELENGKDRSARKALRAAWQKPTHNVVTHAQWITRHALPGLRDDSHIDFSQSSQAATQECIERGDLKGAHQFLELWKHEEPYSGRPFAVESYLHCMTESFEKVIGVFDTAKIQGILPALLINNTVVALACSGRVAGANALFRELKRNPNTIPHFTLLATEGLLELAKGDLAQGRQFYKEAETAAEKQSTFWADQVFLNKLMELYRFGHPVESRERRRLDEIAKRSDGFQLKQLLKNIEKLAALRKSAEDKTKRPSA